MNQTYCILNRTIMDNLFLLRDVIDLAHMDNINLGIFSIDQGKAFDRVNQFYMFSTLKAFWNWRFFFIRYKDFINWGIC